MSYSPSLSDYSRDRVTSALRLPMLLSEWLSSDQYARAICDPDATILWHNRRFSEIVQTSRMFRMERSSLHLAHSRDQAALSVFLRGKAGDRTVLALADDNGDVPWILQCQHIARDPLISGIRIIQPDCDPSIDFEGFKNYYRLTPKETKICQQLLSGMNVESIIKVSQKSSDTIRFHIRNIYRKINVSAREELYACLYKFKFP